MKSRAQLAGIKSIQGDTEMNKRIVFTGGAGKAGRHVVPYLVDPATTC